ncbi:MAG: CRTAC1 family protein [Sedimentisphaerales bacterium]|nr:CRTAC1 family protein [Sedimentisphaerales bacterium]
MNILRTEIKITNHCGNRDCRRKTKYYLAAASVLFCIFADTYAGNSIILNDVTKETGITFVHTDGGCGQRYIMETVSAGLALFDYDGDGYIDIYFLNGAPLKGSGDKTTPGNKLYRNQGNWRFKDVTEKAGVGDNGYGLGVTVGDYDNDGDQDIYLNNYGPNVLYRNNGDSTFTDVTKKAGVDNGFKVGAGTCFLDADKDGDLDLFASNYLDFSYEKHVSTTTRGYPVYANPRFYLPLPDTLYRNNGDGTFTDVSKAYGIGEHAGWGMGTVCADYDNDGDTDIFIANDVGENFLFENDGTGKFEEVGLMSGTAYDLQGDEQGSMGVDCGDYDNDGLLDFYVTSYEGQLAILYRNLGGGMFEDVTLLTGAGANTLAHVTWGNSFVDFDNNGFRDIFVACGHLQDNVESYNDTTTYFAQNILLMNTGNGKFIDISNYSGDGMKIKLSSRGAGFDDLDNDGDVDVVILNSRREPTILRNDSPSEGHWLQARLRGVKTNRDGVGAHVKVVSGDLMLLDEVHSGRGYQSHYGSRLHFGLGNRKRIDRIEVSWIGGGIDVFKNVAVDKLVTLTEGGKIKYQ